MTAQARPVVAEGERSVAVAGSTRNTLIITGDRNTVDMRLQGIGAVLAFAFDGLGARFAESGAFTDNDRSNAVSRALGYEENGRTELAPRGEPRDTIRWRMSAEQWHARPRPPIAIVPLWVMVEPM